MPDDVLDRYPRRPKDMSNLSLREYLANYDKASPAEVTKRTDLKVLDENYGHIKKRLNAALIHHYTPNKANAPENYYRTFLVLFKPWRNPTDIMSPHTTFQEAFMAECETNELMRDYEFKISSQVKSKKLMETNIETKEKEFEDEEVVPEHLNYSEDTLNTISNEVEAVLSENVTPYADIVNSFNSDQLRVFTKIISYLHKQNSEVKVPQGITVLADVSSDPIFLFVSGIGGTGKSFLIKGLTAYIKQVFQLPVVLMAPTGIAASNINGMTIHRILQLPVQHNKTPLYVPLGDLTLKCVRNLLNSVVLFVLDEISMVNNVTLVYIHRRLTEIYENGDQPFASQNLVVFGDLLQLAPVNPGSVFEACGPKELKILKSYGYINLWQFIDYEELTINMRQVKDSRYANICENIRVGIPPEPEDERWLLEKCQFKYSSTNPEERSKALAKLVVDKLNNGEQYTVLMAKNSSAREINYAILNLLLGDCVQIFANDTIHMKRAYIDDDAGLRRTISQLDEDPRNTAGLERILKLKVGAKVMVRRNLDISKGLCNGAIGEIVKFVRHPLSKKVEKLLVKFTSGTHEIKKVKSDFYIKHNSDLKVTREQFPIILAYAMTVHKSQGLTLDRAIVDCGSDIFSKGQIYVALSRVTKSDNLIILNYSATRVKSCHLAKEEYNRLRLKIGLPPLKPTNYVRTRSSAAKPVEFTPSTVKFNVLGTVQDVNTLDNVSVGTFENKNRTSCYSNALLQCLLNLIPQSIIATMDLLGDIARRHKKCEIQSLQHLRNKVGQGFQENQVQCPAEFLDNLLDIDPYNSLKPSFELKVEKWNVCSNPLCDRPTPKAVFSSLYFGIEPPMTTRSYNVKQLIELSLDDKIIEDSDAKCSECRSPLKACSQLISSSKYLIFKVGQNHTGESKLPTKIKGIPTETIKFCGKLYKFNSMLSHWGEIKNNAHYVAWIKKKKWVLLNDAAVTGGLKWPVNAYCEDGKKSAYLLFYSS